MKSLLELFQRASVSFLAANHEKHVQVNLDATIAKYETLAYLKLQDSEQRKQSKALGGASKREASGARCPLVGFTLFRVKLLDWEAKHSSVKDLLDGLRYAGLIRGDREDEIDPKSYVIQKKVSHYSEEKTVIEIET